MTTAATTTPLPLQSLIYCNNNNKDNATHPAPPAAAPKLQLQVLDQLRLPQEKVYVDVPNVQSAWSVIRNMQIRGAPLIAIVACLGLAVDLQNEVSTQELDAIEQMNAGGSDNDLEASSDAVYSYIQGKMDYLTTSRPTAVNLFHAMNELKQAVLEAAKNSNDNDSSSLSPRQRMVQAVQDYAEFALARDEQDNRNIGKFGADELLLSSNKSQKNDNNKITIMTICNTGSLATSGYGTALGVVRAVHERNRLDKVICLETRPYNQGSRLTAFEIVQDHLPGGTLICDSMAAAFMQQQQSQQHDAKPPGVHAVVVGADRVCANGDTANKIGTYSLALCAAAHNVPFYVAAPLTTLDTSLSSGSEIVIEERPPQELLSTSLAPKDIGVWNPAFDVTPAKYIAGIITEKGVILPSPDDGTIDVAGFVEKHATNTAKQDGAAEQEVASASAARRLSVPISYTEQTCDSLPAYLAKNAPEAMQILGATTANDLDCVEMGDGNLNLVFIVTNNNTTTTQAAANNDTKKQVIVKQALPYVRCVGESWPLSLERSYFEYKALLAEKEACPESVPSVYYFSKKDGLIVMQYLAPPNIILRKGFIQGIRYPTMAIDMGTFCAKTLFKTSGFKLSPVELRQQVEFWSKNAEMCSLTEQVVFTEPYMEAPNNRWTSPQLDDDKKAIEKDVKLKMAAARFKNKFVTDTQALIHGDLHTGSVMCSPQPGQTFVIDPEFAFYGPMGFDTGAFIANLFLAYVSQAGHNNNNNNGADYGEWILEQVQIFWTTFVTEFTKLWMDRAEHTGYLYSLETLESAEAIENCQAFFFNELLSDTLGFAGMKMLRRIVGIAHVEDLDSIQDVDVKAQCERHGLEIAKAFIKNCSSFESIQEAIQLAREKKP